MPASQRLRRAHGSRREIPFLPRRQSYQRFRRAFWSAAGAADTSASSCSFLSWCDSAMSQALTDCESPDPSSPIPYPPTGAKPHLLRPTSPPYCLEKPQPCPWRPPKARLSPLPVTQQHLLQSTAHQSKAPNPIRVDLGLPGISFSTA